MNAESAAEVLKSFSPEDEESTITVEVVDGVASMRLTSRSHSERWAVVNTPGDRWFGLGVDGDYALMRLEEDAPHEAVSETLGEYVAIAGAYLHSGGRAVRVGPFRWPAIVVSVDDRQVTIRRTFLAEVRRKLRHQK